MKTTIDKAGRVVIPASVRERVGLEPGAELEVLVDDFSIRLIRTAPRPALVRRGKRLIAKPTVKPSEIPQIDLGRLIEEERNRWPW
jgi:AbrB family looped-hinge helix DNA binding protein